MLLVEEHLKTSQVEENTTEKHDKMPGLILRLSDRKLSGNDSTLPNRWNQYLGSPSAEGKNLALNWVLPLNPAGVAMSASPPEPLLRIYTS